MKIKQEMIIAAPRGRVISDRTDTKRSHFRKLMLGLSSDTDSVSLSVMTLAQGGARDSAGPAVQQTRLGTVCLEWVSLPPVSSSPLSTVPPEDSYQNIRLIMSLPCSVSIGCL